MKSMIISMFALVVSVSAFAGPSGLPVRELSWTDFKEACAHPEQFQAQRPQMNIKITCADTINTWKPMPQGVTNLDRARLVETAVFSDKYNVAAEANQMPIDGLQGACLRFKEVTQKIKTERSISCSDVLSYKGELKEYCAAALDQVRVDNPRLIGEVETGRIVGSCDQGGPASTATRN